MIEHVECIHDSLDPGVFPDGEDTVNRCVHVPEGRVLQYVPPSVAERSDRRRLERARIEPLGCSANRPRGICRAPRVACNRSALPWITDEVRPLIGPAIPRLGDVA